MFVQKQYYALSNVWVCELPLYQLSLQIQQKLVAFRNMIYVHKASIFMNRLLNFLANLVKTMSLKHKWWQTLLYWFKCKPPNISKFVLFGSQLRKFYLLRRYFLSVILLFVGANCYIIFFCHLKLFGQQDLSQGTVYFSVSK